MQTTPNIELNDNKQFMEEQTYARKQWSKTRLRKSITQKLSKIFSSLDGNHNPSSDFQKRDISSPGAQRDREEMEEEEGHGAAMLSLKSHMKLIPVILSYIMSAGRLLRRHPAF
jgi:hypothetical protein